MVVRDVGREVREQPVLALDDAVLVVAEGRRAEPPRAVLGIEVTGLVEDFQRLRDAARFVERALGVPEVEVHPEAREHVADLLDLALQHEAREVVEILAEQRLRAGDEGVHADLDGVLVAVGGFGEAFEHGRGVTAEAFAVDGPQLGRTGPDVVALIAVRREGHGLAAEFEIADPGGHRKDVHLPAGVVHVVLAGDVEAGGLQDIREARAVRGAATMTDVQRTGRVGGHEFHLHLATAADADAAEGVTGGEHGADDFATGLGPEVQVDEAGTGDLGALDPGRVRQLFDHALREFAGIALQPAGELHRDVAGVVAVGGGLRTFEDDGGVGRLGSHDFERGREETGEVGLEIGRGVLGHGRHFGKDADYRPRLVGSRVREGVRNRGDRRRSTSARGSTRAAATTRRESGAAPRGRPTGRAVGRASDPRPCRSAGAPDRTA